MAGPSITINLDIIEQNSRAITRMCADHDISVTGVTKVTCGLPAVAQAMIRGGVAGIGESRLENIHRLRANGVIAPIMLLRVPPLSGAADIVKSADISLNSELTVIRELAREAQRLGKTHNIILMLDLGDLREGFWPNDLLPAVREINELSGVRIRGIGTNLTCYGGVIPTMRNMHLLADYARRIEDKFQIRMEIISGGNSSSLPLVKSGKMPKAVNHLRIGEAILLGRETVRRTPWAGTRQDAFLVTAELIELKEKPSVPIGQIGQDAFGRQPVFKDKGNMARGILNLGREDVQVEGLTPVDSRIKVLGASSDHLLVDLTSCRNECRLGDQVSFLPNYGALLAAMTSAYVRKQTVCANGKPTAPRSVSFLGAPKLFLRDREFLASIEHLGYRLNQSREKKGALKDFIASGGMPIFMGSPSRTIEGFSAFASAVNSAGMIWISPRACLYQQEQRKPAREQSLLARILGYGADALPDAIRLSPEHLSIISLHRASPEESDLIRQLGIQVFTMEDVDTLGMREATLESLRRTGAGTSGVYLYFNPEASDGGKNGLSDRETHLAMELIASSGLLRVLDLSGHSASASSREGRQRRFIASALGKRILDL